MRGVELVQSVVVGLPSQDLGGVDQVGQRGRDGAVVLCQVQVVVVVLLRSLEPEVVVEHVLEVSSGLLIVVGGLARRELLQVQILIRGELLPDSGTDARRWLEAAEVLEAPLHLLEALLLLEEMRGCGGVILVRLLVVHERLLLLVRQADLAGLLRESVLLLLICFFFAVQDLGHRRELVLHRHRGVQLLVVLAHVVVGVVVQARGDVVVDGRVA